MSNLATEKLDLDQILVLTQASKLDLDQIVLNTNQTNNNALTGNQFMLAFSNTLAVSGQFNILIRSSVTKTITINSQFINTSGLLTLGVFEGTTFSSAGASANGILYNKNRNFSSVPNSLFTTGPTITGVGTAIYGLFYCSNQTRFGSTNANENNLKNIILLKNTNYLFQYTNNDSVGISYNNQLEFTEI